MSDVKKLTKALSDAIPLGPHPNPHAEWVQVRLDFVQEAIDSLDWLDKGVAEWRSSYMRTRNQLVASHATSRIAIDHLQAILNESRTADESFQAESGARDWLLSIGSEPG